MIENESPFRHTVAQSTRLLRPEDMASLAQLLPQLGGPLYSERFPGKTCYDFCRWKYFGNPAGDAVVGVALDGDRVVSVVAGTPKRTQLGSEIVLAFELGDFITATDCRKRGFFSTLVNLVCDTAREKSAAFVYVRPNEVSFPILASRLSFVEPKRMDARRYVLLSAAAHRKFGIPSGLIRGLGVDRILRKFALREAPTSVQVEAITRFDDGASELWARTRDQYAFSLVRDTQYLNWRYVDCPTPYLIWAARRQDQLVGYLVAFVSRAQPLGTIVDFFTHPEDEDAAASLLRVAIDAMQQAGTQVVHAWTLQEGAESASTRLLKRTCMFVAKPELRLAMKFLDEHSDARNLPSSGWQLTVGDFDGT